MKNIFCSCFVNDLLFPTKTLFHFNFIFILFFILFLFYFYFIFILFLFYFSFIFILFLFFVAVLAPSVGRVVFLNHDALKPSRRCCSPPTTLSPQSPLPPSPLARFTMCTALELAHPPFWTDLRSDWSKRKRRRPRWKQEQQPGHTSKPQHEGLTLKF